LLCTLLFFGCLALVVPVCALVSRKVFPGPSPKRTPGQLKKNYPSLKGGEDRPWAVVTGASSGIGKEFALLLAAEGFNVAVVARSKDRLEELCAELQKAHGVTTKALCFDLEKREAAAEIHKAVQDLDVSMLINNAGYGSFGPFTGQEVDAIEKMIQLNCTSVAVLTRLFLDDFHKKRPQHRSGLVITASLGAYTPMANSALYNATKVFDQFLSWALHREQQDLNKPVDVLSLEPGSTATQFRLTATAGVDTSKGAASALQVASTALDDLQAKRPNSILVDADYFITVLARVLPKEQLVKIASGFAKKFKTK